MSTRDRLSLGECDYSLIIHICYLALRTFSYFKDAKNKQTKTHRETELCGCMERVSVYEVACRLPEHRWWQSRMYRPVLLPTRACTQTHIDTHIHTDLSHMHGCICKYCPHTYTPTQKELISQVKSSFYGTGSDCR